MKSCCLVLAILISSSSFAYTDSLWIVGNGGYPGDIATVEVWLEYEGSGSEDSISAFDILLTWDASVCTAEVIIIGPDFSAWEHYPKIDNQGIEGPPTIPKMAISAFTFGPPIGPPFVERGTHLAATVDFRIVGLGDSAYVDTLMEAFYPPRYLFFVGKHAGSYAPSYAGGWIIAASASVNDVGPTSIISPPSAVFLDSTYFPSGVIKNFSRDSLGPIPVICTIGSWADTVEVAGLPHFGSAAVTFAGWTVPRPGTHTVTVITQYAADTNRANDTLSIDVRGYLPGDVGPGAIESPPDTVHLGSTYVPSATIRNYGVDTVGAIPVVCTINGWADTVEIFGVAGAESAVVNFADWTVTDTGVHRVTVFTQHPADTSVLNDTLTVSILAMAAPGDVGPISITSPSDTVFFGSSYAPSAIVKNFGADPVGPVPVVCNIDGWSDTTEVALIAGMESTTVKFAKWRVPDTLIYSVTIFTEYPTDTVTSNDTIQKTVHAFMYPRGPEMLWEKTYGGGSEDEGYSVQQTSDGGYIIAGRTQSFGEGWNDMYLIRTDTTGSPVWAKTYGRRYNDAAWSVQQTSDGGYIVAGYYNTDSLGDRGRMWLIKTDASGDSSWSRRVRAGLDDLKGRSVRQTYDSGYIAVGTGRPVADYNLYLVKMSESGDVLWTRSYGQVGIHEYGYAVEETADSGYVIAGQKSWFDDADVYVIKTDRNGEVLWKRTYGGDRADIGRSVKQMMDGGYIVAGQTKSFGDGDEDVYVIRVDESGDLIWERAYGGLEDDVGRSICETSDGGYVVAGSTNSFSGYWWDVDVWLIKIDKEGNVMWAETYGRGAELGHSVQETSDGGYIIAGLKKRIPGGGDVYLIKTKGWVGIQEERLRERHFLICMGRPNPFTDRTSIQYELPERREVCITIYNLLGQEVKTLLNEHQPAGIHTTVWNATDNSGRRVPSGTYFLRLEAHTGLAAGPYTVTRKLCVVR